MNVFTFAAIEDDDDEEPGPSSSASDMPTMADAGEDAVRMEEVD
jgi:hypothetical protein